MGITRFHIFVSGRVQGVSFRANTMLQAQALNITGWVRNLPDHRVEIVAEGDAKSLETFLNWTHQGPEYAKVTHVELIEEVSTDPFSDFQIR